MNHPTQQELLDYAGRTIDEHRGAEILLHLAACDRCRAAASAMSAVEGALHRLPVERPSASFTAGVLARIGIRESTPLWWLFFRNFAPILVAGCVAGTVMMLGAGGDGAAQGSPSGNSLFDPTPVRVAVGGAMDAMSAWMGRMVSTYASIRVANDSMNQMIFIACLFAGIGLLDRFVFGPLVRRRR
jgi:anti-sigma factor RsiW